MLELSKEQHLFLDKHWLNVNIVFDASWMKRKQYQTIMENLEKHIAIGVSPCKKEWHTMKAKSWHCIQCKTECISFINRRYREAYIYVAASKKGLLLKVGFTKDIEIREIYLNNNKYAWLNDWEIIYYAKYHRAWEIEKKIHNELSDYRYRKEYNFYWKNMISHEIFSCNYETIKKILEKVKSEIGESKITNEKEAKDAKTIYDFPIIKNKNKRI